MMSAIAGIYNTNEPIPKNHGLQMMQALRKFPADDVQIWSKENIFLGNHAQWITPESIGEQLPFHDYDRQLTITSDAMIDNRNELFDKLGIHHEERKIMPDGQLILLAYSKWGEDVVKHLIGDFAFMIWDEKKQKLFGARDFSGTRSLYYYHNGEKFAFCTVIGPLLRLPYIKRQLNEEALAEFLAIPNMIDAVSVSETIIKDIQQIAPSHTITVINGKVKQVEYQALSFGKEIKFKNDEEYVEAFRDVFQKAVDSRLRTYKPVGSQLSGGLDSGSVVSFAVKTLEKQNKKLHTYSSIPVKDFDDYTPDFYFPDERPFISATVDYVGNIEEHYLSLDDKNSYTDINGWLEIIETPYKSFENSFWIKGTFEEASKEGIGILLSGARGNFTISWGPAFDYYAHLLKRIRWIHFAQELKNYSRNLGIGRKILLEPIGKTAFPFLDKEENYRFPPLINPGFAAKTNVYKRIKRFGIEANGFSKQTINNQRNFMIENGFIWNTNGTTFTKLSLQYGLLLRDPTNDIRVVNYCKSIPINQFINKGMDRALIRNATQGYLPDQVRLNQQYKGVQGMDWVHRMSSNWTDLIRETQALLKNKYVTQYLNKESIYKALSKVKDGHRADLALNPQLRGLMRSIIVYRFLKLFTLEGGDNDEKRMENSKPAIIRY